ncbi:MAG TPA: hypothetical protein VHM91_22580 [Verrucomicrobiales bacterium]|jgi:hypothetical protein|nr:hypothetical protein [Verrucomicrobiales bacterium]
MNTHRIVYFTTAAVLALTGSIAQAEAPKKLEFSITKGANPDGKGNYSGKVSFSREDAKTPYKVTWTLSNGDSYTGYGVASGDYMAVAYGSEAMGVAIYKVNEKTVDGTWAPAKDGAALGTYELKRGKVKHQYVYSDGTPGTITIAPSEVKNVANVSYEMPDKKFGGIGLMDGDYMAVGAATGLKDFGVVIYRMNKDLSASGKWIIGGATTIGTEDLKLLTIDGKPAPKTGDAPPSDTPKKDKEMDNADLAKLIAVDLEKCAAVGEYFIDQMKADDMDAVVGLLDNRAFDEKTTREKFATGIAEGRKALGKLKDFTPDKKKVDFKPVSGGGMLFTLEGDATYDNAKTHEVFRFLKPRGEEKVVIVGYSRSVKK